MKSQPTSVRAGRAGQLQYSVPRCPDEFTQEFAKVLISGLTGGGSLQGATSSWCWGEYAFAISCVPDLLKSVRKYLSEATCGSPWTAAWNLHRAQPAAFDFAWALEITLRRKDKDLPHRAVNFLQNYSHVKTPATRMMEWKYTAMDFTMEGAKAVLALARRQAPRGVDMAPADAKIATAHCVKCLGRIKGADARRRAAYELLNQSIFRYCSQNDQKAPLVRLEIARAILEAAG